MAAASTVESSNSSSTMKAIAPLVAGFSGGTVGTILLMPLDNIKVRLQVNEGVATGKLSASSSSSPVSVNSLPNDGRTRIGSIRMFQGVMKHEGIRGLYQGLVPAVVGSAVSWGGFFFVYEDMKRRLRHYKERNAASPEGGEGVVVPVTLNSWENFQVATLSGAIMVILTNPIWLIKTRMQLQMKKTSEQMHVKTVQYDGFFDAIQKIVRQEGFWALYKGSGPAMLLTSHGGVQFVVYEFLRKHFHYARDTRDATLDQGAKESSSILKRFEKSFGYLMMGAVSKMVASTVTYPFQVMKSRMQQPSSSIELTSTGDVRVVKRDYTGMVATVMKIYQQEGVSGFFKGAIPNAVRVAPNAAVTFVTYEAVMDMLQ